MVVEAGHVEGVDEAVESLPDERRADRSPRIDDGRRELGLLPRIDGATEPAPVDELVEPRQGYGLGEASFEIGAGRCAAGCWTPPANTGGSDITDYKVTVTTTGGQGLSWSQTSWCVVWKCHSRLPVLASTATMDEENRLAPLRSMPMRS